jgi:signal transduction histidine kinase
MADEELKIVVITLLCSLIILGLAITILFLIEKYKKRLYLSAQKIELLKLDFEKKILETQLEIQESTFNQISSEIHDNISLGLTLSKLQITNYLDKKEENFEKLILAVDLISKSLIDLNDISKSLDGNKLLEYGLIDAIESEISVLQKTGIYDVDLVIIGEPFFLDQKMDLVILRIMQEACNNILKHAQANNIRVELHFEPELFKMKVIDNGIGFDQIKVNEKKQIRKMSGLKNVYSRSEIVGGKFEIISKENSGTTILISIPLNKKEK